MYLQLNSDGTFYRELSAIGNIEFDANHFCPAGSLTSDEATLFRVIPLVTTNKPMFDEVTQQCARDGVEFINDQWQYKWVVSQLDSTHMQFNVVNAVQNRVDVFAKSRGYDNVNSISKYQNLTDTQIASLPESRQSKIIQFRAECQYLALVTAETWAALYAAFDEVQVATRPMPMLYSEIEALLPALEWPV